MRLRRFALWIIQMNVWVEGMMMPTGGGASSVDVMFHCARLSTCTYDGRMPVLLGPAIQGTVSARGGWVRGGTSGAFVRVHFDFSLPYTASSLCESDPLCLSAQHTEAPVNRSISIVATCPDLPAVVFDDERLSVVCIRLEYSTSIGEWSSNRELRLSVWDCVAAALNMSASDKMTPLVADTKGRGISLNGIALLSHATAVRANEISTSEGLARWKPRLKKLCGDITPNSVLRGVATATELSGCVSDAWRLASRALAIVAVAAGVIYVNHVCRA